MPPMDMREINAKLADEINVEALRDPTSPYAGKYVGIANGKVIIASDNLDEVAEHLDRLRVDPENAFCIFAGYDYDTPEMIWALSQWHV